VIRLEHSGSRGAANAVGQTEFPLRVAVCAWCKPRELGAGLGALSHGICPRHFREMKVKLQKRRLARESGFVGQRTHRSDKPGGSIRETAQLRFPFPAPVVASQTVNG